MARPKAFAENLGSWTSFAALAEPPHFIPGELLLRAFGSDSSRIGTCVPRCSRSGKQALISKQEESQGRASRPIGDDDDDTVQSKQVIVPPNKRGASKRVALLQRKDVAKAAQRNLEKPRKPQEPLRPQSGRCALKLKAFAEERPAIARRAPSFPPAL